MELRQRRLPPRPQPTSLIVCGALRPLVGDGAEQPRGLFRVVDRRMRLVAVPGIARSLHGAREHGLTIGDPGERNRVEHAEGMERIALVAAACDCGVDE